MIKVNLLFDKVCVTCLRALPLTCFAKNKQCVGGRRKHCRDCLKQKRPRGQSDRDRDKARYKTLRRKSWAADNFYRRVYGISLEDYARMLNNQNLLCGCCGDRLNHNTNDRATHLDHNHSTGTVRAIVCRRCNSLIGLCNESEEYLAAVANYLRMHNA